MYMKYGSYLPVFADYFNVADKIASLACFAVALTFSLLIKTLLARHPWRQQQM